MRMFKNENVIKNENVFIDKNRAMAEAKDDLSRFEPMARAINELKTRNAPLYWDVLWDALKGNTTLTEEYAKKHAELTNEDWNDQDTRNLMRKKFSYLHDNEGHSFPQEWCIRKEDGSFDSSLIEIVKSNEKTYTYRFTDEQMKAINEVVNGLATLQISPYHVTSMFYNNNGDVWANYPRLFDILLKK